MIQAEDIGYSEPFPWPSPLLYSALTMGDHITAGAQARQASVHPSPPK